ncbi:TPA: BREX-3 system P-loop-containing protein BrxF [Candidatus Bathyarchaeota archaeon]|nr:BREX-3 system P-loop-containing protein BrxF [Candidatus Bathyarchaeota archaeon]
MISPEVCRISKHNLNSVHLILSDQILKKIQLLLIVGKMKSGKTQLLKILHSKYKDGPLINLGLKLSKKFVECVGIDFYEAMDEILGNHSKVYLDNLEILTDPYLNRDSIRELVKLSRKRKVVATLIGEVRDNIVYYQRNMRCELNNLNNSFVIHIVEEDV